MAGRKIVYFLGAGAPYGAGAAAPVQGGGELRVPTQAQFWQTFLRFCSSNDDRKKIERFLFRYFMGYAKVPSRSKPAQRHRLLNGIDVEEVFTFLSERARAPSTTPQLRSYTQDVWQALVDEVGVVFRRFKANARTRRLFRAFYRNHIKRFDAVVSFNYDTVFEDSLAQSVSWGYQEIDDTTGALPILKPHGSVNWEFSDGSIQRADEPQHCVVVAPTHLKFVSTGDTDAQSEGYAGYLDQSATIQRIWSEMERQMKEARALVFIGYSFPVADLYFSSLLRSVLASRNSAPDVVLVNPDAVALAKRLSLRFAIDQPLRYFDMAQFVQIRRRDVLSQLR